MTGYLLKRLLQSLFAVWGVVTLVFLILQISGDPAMLMAPEGASGEDIALIRSQLGFDRPMIVQYGAYLWSLVGFDLGQSFVQNLPVLEIIGARVPYTIYLAFPLPGSCIAMSCAMPPYP